MEVKKQFVTPDQATKWLEGNTHNRKLHQSVVERYARDMKAGKWQLTHEAIAFDSKNTLIDGQHRLWAVIESNTGVWLMVAWGVRAETRGVINSGLVRSTADQIRLGHGLDVSPVEVAIAKRLKTAAKGSITSTEALDCLTRHRDAISTAIRAFPRPTRGITIVPVLTVIARAYYHVQGDTASLFRVGEVLTEGKVGTGEEALLLLRNWLLARAPRSSGTKGASGLIYQKTERGVFAFLRRENLSTLYSAPAELFPLPDEKLDRVRMKKPGPDGSKNVTVVVAAKGTKRLPTKGKAVEAAKRRKGA
jgi:hypothetical protein